MFLSDAAPPAIQAITTNETRLLGRSPNETSTDDNQQGIMGFFGIKKDGGDFFSFSDPFVGATLSYPFASINLMENAPKNQEARTRLKLKSENSPVFNLTLGIRRFSVSIPVWDTAGGNAFSTGFMGLSGEFSPFRGARVGALYQETRRLRYRYDEQHNDDGPERESGATMRKVFIQGVLGLREGADALEESMEMAGSSKPVVHGFVGSFDAGAHLLRASGRVIAEMPAPEKSRLGSLAKVKSHHFLLGGGYAALFSLSGSTSLFLKGLLNMGPAWVESCGKRSCATSTSFSYGVPIQANFAHTHDPHRVSMELAAVPHFIPFRDFLYAHWGFEIGIGYRVFL